MTGIVFSRGNQVGLFWGSPAHAYNAGYAARRDLYWAPHSRPFAIGD